MCVLTVLTPRYSSTRDLRRREVRRQVAQHADLALRKRFEQRLRLTRHRSLTGYQARDVRDERGMRGALAAMTLQQLRSAMEQERQHQAVALGELECPAGRARVWKRVAGNRLDQ